jgi:hypothetical protein
MYGFAENENFREGLPALFIEPATDLDMTIRRKQLEYTKRRRTFGRFC